jgi:hypothetical protein
VTKKTSIHLSDELHAAVTERTLHNRGDSATVTLCLARYFEVMRASLPVLTEPEWLIVRRVVHEDRPPPNLLWAAVESGGHIPLAMKIKGMSTAELIALYDCADRRQ